MLGINVLFSFPGWYQLCWSGLGMKLDGWVEPPLSGHYYDNPGP